MVRSFSHLRAATATLAVLAIGCGGSDHRESSGIGLSIDSGTVRIHCGGADCSAFIGPDEGGFVVDVARTIDGRPQELRRVVQELNDVDIQTGDGNDHVLLWRVVVPGTVHIATGGGDDLVDFCDAGALGDTRIGTGAGNDFVNLAVQVFARLFEVDLGDGDDELGIDGSNFQGEIRLDGGAGDDTLDAGTDVQHAAHLAGFERCVSGSCPAPG